MPDSLLWMKMQNFPNSFQYDILRKTVSKRLRVSLQLQTLDLNPAEGESVPIRALILNSY